MSPTPRNADACLRKGSHQTVSSELTPRESHPNCRSDRAALIACGGLATARTFPKEKMRGLCTENLIFQKFFELLQDFHDVPAVVVLVNPIDTA